ncbi:MAG: ABC transporter permease [Spirochaetales bacterium]|nr:ABC transporter permease [Spirochaetales bacterium]
MIGRLKPIIKKEFRHMLRDKRTLGVLIFLPVFLMVMFGYAISLDVKHIPLGIYDEDRTAKSLDFAGTFFHSEHFDFKTYVVNYKEIDNLILGEEIKAVLVIPPDFSDTLLSGEKTKVQVLIDGSNSTIASTIVGYMEMIIRDYSEKIDLQASEMLQDILLPIDVRQRIWYNPELLSARFLIPGLIVLILVVTSVISTSLSIVREKEQGTMQQIAISPVHPTELVIGKIIPYFLLSIVITAGVLVLSYFLFEVTVRGSLLLLSMVIIIFLIGNLGLGTLFSTMTDTQQTAFFVSTLITVLPTYILSGFVFPIRNMPVIIQWITSIIPARYFLSALRNIMVKGVGIEVIYPDVIFLCVFAGCTILVSIGRLRKGVV